MDRRVALTNIALLVGILLLISTPVLWNQPAEAHFSVERLDVEELPNTNHSYGEEIRKTPRTDRQHTDTDGQTGVPTTDTATPTAPPTSSQTNNTTGGPISSTTTSLGPREESTDGRPNISYENLSTEAQRAFRLALEADGSRVTVYGEENIPDDLVYITDYVPDDGGIYIVRYEGETYKFEAIASGGLFGNVIYSFSMLLVSIYGLLTVLIGTHGLSRENSVQIALATVVGGFGLLSIGLIAPELFGGIGFLASFVLTLGALGSLVYLRGCDQWDPADS